MDDTQDEDPDSDLEFSPANDVSDLIVNSEESFDADSFKRRLPTESPRVRIGRLDIDTLASKYVRSKHRPAKRIRLRISSSESD